MVKVQHDALHGMAATFIVTLAGLEAFLQKLLSSVLIAVISAVAVHFMRRWLEKPKA